MARNLWRLYCPVEQQYVTVISLTKPLVCPNDGTEVDPNITEIIDSDVAGIVSDGYINIESILADNQAIRINASDPNGGIQVNAGFGGIRVDTTNSISLDAAAASNFTTSNGNLELKATAGLVNIESGSGINVGEDAATPIVNVAASANSKTVNIGNNTGTTAVAIRSGSGKITLNSADTTPTAIQTYSSGGTDIQAAGVIKLASADNTVNAITMDSSFNGGGMVFASGAQGIFFSSNGGPIGVGAWSGGDVFIGTAGVARNIVVGNNIGSSALINRYGAGGYIRHQEPIIALADADAVLLISQILAALFTITPTATRTLTLPTAVDAVAGMVAAQIGDAVDFNIINLAAGIDVVLAAGTGGSIVGNTTITGNTTGIFRLRLNNVTSGTESYTVYRLN